jgi:spore maturation protein CgeB
MKYFEIPACGTLLFAEETEALPGLGFQDGENFVAVTPANFRERLRYYLREAPPDTVDRIARAGRDLVLARHTWSRRAGEILEALRRMV